MAVALSLRLAYYLINPTLSTDEAQVALNLMHRSYGELLEQLDFNQAAPVGFLFVEKFLTSVVGDSEYSLRLFPFLTASAAALLFYPVATRMIGRRASLLALALFAVSELLLIYSATIKQYAGDVVVAVTLYGLVLWTIENFRGHRLVVLAVAGAGAVWFSHPAIFIGAGICSVLIIEGFLRRDWHCVVMTAVVGTIWFVSFALFYALTHTTYSHVQRSLTGNAAVLGVEGSWEGESRLKVYGGTIRALFGIPHFPFALRNALVLIALFLCLIGFLALVRERRIPALLLLGPMPFVFVASALGKYPLFPRTLLFLIPALILAIAYGVHFLIRSERPRSIQLIGAFGCVAVVASAAVAPFNHLRVKDGGELKQAMRHIVGYQRRDEALYVYAAAQYDVRYYLECECLGNAATVSRARALWPLNPARGGPDQAAPTMRSVLPSIVVGTATGEEPRDYRSEFAPLMGRRVWVLIAAAPGGSRRAVMDFLGSIGTPESTFRTKDDTAIAVLYDLGS